MPADTINVQLKQLPVINLGNDTAICQGKSLVLTSHQPAGSTYSWNTGNNGDSITISTPGTYWLAVTDSGCIDSGSIQVSEITIPTILLGQDTILCKGDLLTLSTGNVLSLWSTGVNATNITVTDSGTYWASVTNECGTGSDSINVTFEPCDLYFPSGFTPNNDGRNDIARAVGYLNFFRDYSLSIYNRWGQRIFYTEDIYSGWDGTFNGVTQNIGTYFYMIYYTLEGKRHMMKGDLTLIR